MLPWKFHLEIFELENFVKLFEKDDVLFTTGLKAFTFVREHTCRVVIEGPLGMRVLLLMQRE